MRAGDADTQTRRVEGFETLRGLAILLVIVEHALLRIRDGQAADFEEAMRQAVPLIASSPGFRGIEIRPALEVPGFIAFYRSAPGFTGADVVTLEVKFPNGRTEIQKITVNVGTGGPGQQI